MPSAAGLFAPVSWARKWTTRDNSRSECPCIHEYSINGGGIKYLCCLLDVWQNLIQYLCIVPWGKVANKEESTARCLQSSLEPTLGHPSVEVNDHVFHLIDLLGSLYNRTSEVCEAKLTRIYEPPEAVGINPKTSIRLLPCLRPSLHREPPLEPQLSVPPVSENAYSLQHGCSPFFHQMGWAWG